MRIGDLNKKIIIQAQKSGKTLITNGSGVDFSTDPGMIGADGYAAVRIPGVNLLPYVGIAGKSTPYFIEITDSSGKEITGYLAEADDAEATTELVTNGDNEAAEATFDEDANTSCVSAQDAGQAHGGTKSTKLTQNIGGDGIFYRTFKDTDESIVANGKLLKISAWVYNPSTNGATKSSLYLYHYNGSDSVFVYTNTMDEWVQLSLYGTPTTQTFIILFAQDPGYHDGDIQYWDDISIAEVTALGTDGCHVVSTRNGSTQNWASKESGFDWNDASGYSYAIYRHYGAADGMGGYESEWDDIGSVWTSIWPISATEQIQSAKSTMIASHRIRMRYRSDIKANWRLKYHNSYYNIVSIINHNMANRMLELLVKEAT